MDGQDRTAPATPSQNRVPAEVRDRRWLVDILPSAKALAFAAVALALGLALQDLVWALARPLALLTLAFVIALALAPIVDGLSRWMPRTLQHRDLFD